jgi:ubiquinone/menaquinone biosynthesis C-methylase UbiE
VSTDFDERAATWDDNPAIVERAKAVAGAIRDAVVLDPSMRMLEYGAGTGLVTQALQESVGPVTLADTSAGMREVMAQKIAAGAITDARVWDVDLSTGPAPDERFDVVVTVMALHHVPEVGPLLSNLAALLVEGGVLCIVDLEEEDGSFHGDDFHGHRGFARAALTSELSEVGFTDIGFQRCYEMVRDGRSYPLFLSTSVRHLDDDAA